MRPTHAWVAAIAVAALLAPCGCGGDPPATPATPGAAANAETSGAPLRFENGRVSVARNEVLQLALLEELAARAGFELEVAGVAPRSITLRLDAVPLLDAISAILEGTAFRAQYAVDRATGAHVLAKLSVGELRTAAVATPGPAAAIGTDTAQAQAEARKQKLSRFVGRRREETEQHARTAVEIAEERRTREAAALEQLASSDAERRADALGSIDPSGDAVAQIGELARSDPDPRVRAAAVERLGDADTYQATSILLDSLADPSPQVVVAALEAIEYSGDHSLLARIEPLANHANPAVREAAREAIDSLQ